MLRSILGGEKFELCPGIRPPLQTLSVTHQRFPPTRERSEVVTHKRLPPTRGQLPEVRGLSPTRGCHLPCDSEEGKGTWTKRTVQTWEQVLIKTISTILVKGSKRQNQLKLCKQLKSREWKIKTKVVGFSATQLTNGQNKRNISKLSWAELNPARLKHVRSIIISSIWEHIKLQVKISDKKSAQIKNDANKKISSCSPDRIN